MRSLLRSCGCLRILRFHRTKSKFVLPGKNGSSGRYLGLSREQLFKLLVVFLFALLTLQYGLNIAVTKRYYLWSQLVNQYMLQTNGNISQVRRLISRGSFHMDRPGGMLRFLLLDPRAQDTQGLFDGMDKKEVLPYCPLTPPNLVGPIPVTFERPSFEELEEQYPDVDHGGMWQPANCTARHRVALILPFRDREEHLRIFLSHMHPFLQKQQLDYTIYVIEQLQPSRFNRAMLLNIGFVESSHQYAYDCFIFHDVDLLPEDDRNIYSCPSQPRHMAAAVDTLGYRLMYDTIFGGVEAFSKEHFKLVNGFSNMFFGWGAEDDDLYNRIRYHGLNLTRYPMNIARYRMIRHSKDDPSPDRFRYLKTGDERYEFDGLNSLKYDRKKIERRKLYTKIIVDIHEEDVLNQP